MTLTLFPGATVDLALALDHGQFAVLDRGATIDADAYTPEALELGLAEFDGGIVVFTESNWTSGTPLQVRMAEARPDVDVSGHEHVVVGGLDCSSGELRIFSPEETGANERALSVPAGRYGVIVYGDGFGQADEHGDDGADRYEVRLWPTDQLPEAQSLKPGLTS